jgi:hypothetical protein
LSAPLNSSSNSLNVIILSNPKKLGQTTIKIR